LVALTAAPGSVGVPIDAPPDPVNVTPPPDPVNVTSPPEPAVIVPEPPVVVVEGSAIMPVHAAPSEMLATRVEKPPARRVL